MLDSTGTSLGGRNRSAMLLLPVLPLGRHGGSAGSFLPPAWFSLTSVGVDGVADWGTFLQPYEDVTSGFLIGWYGWGWNDNFSGIEWLLSKSFLSFSVVPFPVHWLEKASFCGAFCIYACWHFLVAGFFSSKSGMREANNKNKTNNKKTPNQSKRKQKTPGSSPSCCSLDSEVPSQFAFSHLSVF